MNSNSNFISSVMELYNLFNVQNIFFGVLNTYDHFHVATLYESANIAKNKSSYFTPELRSKLWCGGRTG